MHVHRMPVEYVQPDMDAARGIGTESRADLYLAATAATMVGATPETELRILRSVYMDIYRSSDPALSTTTDYTEYLSGLFERVQSTYGVTSDAR